jgi:carboxymethylenebutenolidase
MRFSLPSGTAVEIARTGDDPEAGLVIIPDIMGLRPLFDKMVADLARTQPWNVVALEPFSGLEHLDL